ncbi:MAG: hypothetical protein HYU64_13525, partial [Armatimonadetes bacterium]|nr:hypothetical protein [Armatimonadota bacterium]
MLHINIEKNIAGATVEIPKKSPPLQVTSPEDQDIAIITGESPTHSP